MATSDVKVTPGTGANLAAYSITEDAETKLIGRVTLNTSAGAEIGTSSAPVQVSLANTAANSTAVKVDNSAVTQPSSIADGSSVTLGSKTDAKSTATDATSVSAMQVLKQISASVQSPPSQAVTNAGTFAAQATLQAGTNIAGKFGIDQTTPGTTNKVSIGTDGTVALNSAVPAGTNLIGQVSSSNETSTIYSGTTALTPTFAVLTASASGVTNLVALVTSKKIRVLAISLIANGTVNVKFQSHVTPTDISGLYYLAANVGFVLPYNPLGWFQTVSGEALDINLSAAVAVGGNILYVAV